jgi:3-oxoadipate enol-lactonase
MVQRVESGGLVVSSRAQARLGDMELIVPVEGGVVWAEHRGAEGVAVVMLHPGWGDSSIWDEVVSRLPERARTIRYDAPGYGRSPAPTGPFTALTDLIEVLDRLDINEAIVVGHSAGGATAVGLALAQPERVCSLILVAPGIGDYPWPDDDPYMEEFDALFAAGDRDGLVGLGTRTWAAAGDGPEVEAQIRSGVKGMFTQGDLLNPDPPAFDRLAEIHVPTSLVIGDLDHPLVVDCGNAIGARLVDCRVITVHGVDHMLPLREPQRIAELVAAALTRCS